MKPTIGIFTTFAELNPEYSLASVVKDQLYMHVKNGYKTVLFTLPHFEGEVPEGVEIRKVVPAILIEPYKGTSFPENWEDDVKTVKEALEEHAQDIDIAITHDWIFIDSFVPYNIGMREANLKCKKFHWVHSAPSPRQQLTDNPHASRYELPPNSKLVYLNNDKALDLAEMYGRWLRDVRVIYNSIDPRTFWGVDPFVSEMMDKYDLLSSDVTSVYPVSSTRMVDGKQVHVVIRIHAELKKLGYRTRLIIPNAHCNGDKEKKQVDELLEFGKKYGLTKYEILFTSKEGHENGVSRKVVSDFFKLSNLFIFPSISENCSLVLLEAMINGNLLVLNKDCSGLQEFGQENALYFKMGNLDMGIRNEEDALKKDGYIADVAKIIKSELEINKPLKAKMSTFNRFNLDTIFSKIDNLYYEQ